MAADTKLNPVKSAIVTGGSAGLGIVIANRLLAHGYAVTLMGRDPSRLEEAKLSLLQDAGKDARVETYVGNACSVSDAEQMIRSHVESFGRLDALVNVVGQSDRGLIENLEPARLRALFEANVISALVCSQAAMTSLGTSGGTIVNIGSLASHAAPRYMGGYVAAKHALAGMTRQLRMECEADGIHVGLVCPGPIARPDANTRYQVDSEAGVPQAAAGPGGGAKLKGLAPERVAEAVMTCIEKRKIEIILPAKARILMLLDAISPKIGDWLLSRSMK